jgi:AraC-like DNA-binding protein
MTYYQGWNLLTMDGMTIHMDDMTSGALSECDDTVYRFFFGRTDLTSFGIQCLGCGRARRSFRMRQLLEKQQLLHYGCVFVAEGEGFFESAHQPRTAIGANEAMFLYPGDWHSYGCAPDGDWLEYWIVFDGNVIRRAPEEGRLCVKRPLVRVRDPEYVTGLFHACAEAADSDSPHEQRRLPGMIHQILDEILPPGAALKLSHSAAEVVSRVQQAIRRNPAEEFDFKELARENGVSYSLLRQRFKQAYGLSLVAFRNQARMNLACTLLAQGCSVKDTAGRVGVEDPLYFSRQFRRIIGAWPTDFRNRLEG